MKQLIKGEHLYSTDNYQQARLIRNKSKETLVQYSNRSRDIPLTLTFIARGRKYTKYNPEYIEHLKSLYPELSDEEINVELKKRIKEQAPIKVLIKTR